MKLPFSVKESPMEKPGCFLFGWYLKNLQRKHFGKVKKVTWEPGVWLQNLLGCARKFGTG